jgi:hypothetical protein
MERKCADPATILYLNNRGYNVMMLYYFLGIGN